MRWARDGDRPCCFIGDLLVNGAGKLVVTRAVVLGLAALAGCKDSPPSDSIASPRNSAAGVRDSNGLIPPDELTPIGAAAYAPRQANTLTFTKDIAPTVFENCAICHRPGEAAPFTLLSYEDVKKRAKQIATVVASRFMPPWQPEPGYNEFAGQRGLTSDQIGVIRQWVEEGAIKGDPADLPAVPEWTEGWQLGEPDLIVDPPEPYILPAGGPEVFRNLVIPDVVSSVRYVQAFEFRPGNAKIVHHAEFRVDETPWSLRFDEEDPEPGFGGMHTEGATFPDGHLPGWAPGRTPSMGSEGMAWRLRRGADLLLNLHLLPSGKPEPVQPKLGLFFADEPPTQLPLIIRLGSLSMDIPAGEKEYLIQDSYVLPVDVDVLSVFPHAHYLGKDMKGFATLPDGTKKWLLRIRDWDFNWQDEYRYVEPIFLPKGTILGMQFTYDNSADNVRNPNQPPERVVFGPNSSDEMGDFWVQAMTRSREDLAVLRNDYEHYDAQRTIALYEAINVSSYWGHSILAQHYVKVGRIDEAITHFKESIRLKPGHAITHNNLAMALYKKGEVDEAIGHLQRAVEIDPLSAEAQANLAHMLESQGELDEAIRHFREAVRISADSSGAHYYLGRALERTGRVETALEHFREAVRLEPDWILALNSTAWLLATHPGPGVRDPDEAIRLARHASELTRDQHPVILETLAAAYAAAGQFDRAVSTSERALGFISGPEADELTASIRDGLALYRESLPRRFTRAETPGSRELDRAGRSSHGS